LTEKSSEPQNKILNRLLAHVGGDVLNARLDRCLHVDIPWIINMYAYDMTDRGDAWKAVLLAVPSLAPEPKLACIYSHFTSNTSFPASHYSILVLLSLLLPPSSSP
jgi:hypothetical protein